MAASIGPKGTIDSDLSSRSAQLCMAGTQAEFDRRLDDAFERMGDAAQAREYFDLAAALGVLHRPE